MSSNSAKESNKTLKYVQPYNFKQPKLFSKEIMRTLRSLHEVLARNLARVYGSTLRKKVDVSVAGIQQVSASEFLLGIESPSVIFLLDEETLTDDIIIVMSSGFCIHMIEKQSGGRGNNISEKRTLTTIEEKIMNRIMDNISKEVVNAWEPFEEFNIISKQFENKPENVHLTSVDPMLVVTLLIDLGEVKTEVKISYSYGLLKQAINNSIIKQTNRAKTGKLSDTEKVSYQRTLLNASIVVQPLLGSSRLTVEEIMNLKVGDSIALNQRIDQPLEVRVNGIQKMSAYPGLVHGRRAVKVYEIDNEINEKELI
ncbi:MAG: FliM/FliN family flagellar motor switch protein [Balneolaceae bacterium]